MTVPIVLTAEELRELTGFTKPGKQIAWLRAEGFTFRVAADGHPRVDRSHYLKMMGGAGDPAPRHKKTSPDFSPLLKLIQAA